ncbi:MAG: TIGR03435 family protein [Edaphobacter sp.]
MLYRPDGSRCLFVILCGLLLTACLGISVRAQGPEQDWEKEAGGKQQFEVASVREDKLDGQSSSNFMLDGNGNTYWMMNKSDRPAPEGNLFRATNQPLLRYIIFAYKLGGTQELPLRLQFWAGMHMNVPAWVKDTRFDIDARAPEAATKDQMRLMMQSLLAERFKLAVHQETRQAPVFAMTLKKPGTLGPQLRAHPASDPCATTVFSQAASAGADTERNLEQKSEAGSDRSQTLPIPCGMIARLPPSGLGRHRIGGRNVTLAMVAESLPAQTGLATFPRPVIDRTGLSGTFDFTLEWTQVEAGDMAVGPNAQGEGPGPPIAQALKQQLGLSLESTKGPVVLLVIDHVERPTANGEK